MNQDQSFFYDENSYIKNLRPNKSIIEKYNLDKIPKKYIFSAIGTLGLTLMFASSKRNAVKNLVGSVVPSLLLYIITNQLTKSAINRHNDTVRKLEEEKNNIYSSLH